MRLPGCRGVGPVNRVAFICVLTASAPPPPPPPPPPLPPPPSLPSPPAGKGNAIKSAMSRARNEDNAPKAGGGGAAGKAARTSGQTKVVCAICKAEVNGNSKVQLVQHQDAKHGKMTFEQCWPGWTEPS